MLYSDVATRELKVKGLSRPRMGDWYEARCPYPHCSQLLGVVVAKVWFISTDRKTEGPLDFHIPTCPRCKRGPIQVGLVLVDLHRATLKGAD
jgi:hypothetical protein